ncbi:MAG: DUF2442 domain-containing protein [Alkalinema sp. CAN_BIN05]|nr:DUF2442 domain-containing protein [Alkalinema sp. CAN_BIN05]
MNKLYDVQDINFNDDVMLLTVNGECYHVAVKDASDRLFQASDIDRRLYKIAPSGYGIHWITLDEDLSIQGLLKIATIEEKVT